MMKQFSFNQVMDSYQASVINSMERLDNFISDNQIKKSKQSTCLVLR